MGHRNNDVESLLPLKGLTLVVVTSYLHCASLAAPLSFKNPINLASGVHPHAVYLAFLDSDRHLDMVTVNAGSGTLAVFLGQGNGTFKQKVSYAVPANTEPKSAAIADFNGDGRHDVVTVNQQGGNYQDVSVFINRGRGKFKPVVNYQGVAGCHGIASGDFNNDGKLDVVVVGWGGGIAAVLLGRGDGTFGQRTVYQTGWAPHSVTVGDFNGDGFQDFATANLGSNTVSVILNNEAGGFLPQVTYGVGTNPHSVASGDLNKDGKIDLVAANDGSNSVAVLFGMGDGKFKASVFYDTCMTPKTVIIGDVDGDGKRDILASCIRNNYPNLVNPGGDPVTILRNLGGGNFGDRTDVKFGQGAFSVAQADLNGDGKHDLVVADWFDGNVGMRLGA